VNLDLYVQRLNDIDRSFGALLKQLPNKSEVEALLVEINQAGMGRGLQFDLFKPGPEQIKDFYAELPITVRLTGTYHDFGCVCRRHRQAVQDRHPEQHLHRHQSAEQGWSLVMDAPRRRPSAISMKKNWRRSKKAAQAAKAAQMTATAPAPAVQYRPGRLCRRRSGGTARVDEDGVPRTPGPIIEPLPVVEPYEPVPYDVANLTSTRSPLAKMGSGGEEGRRRLPA
jgi:hypothetical protein